MLRGRYGFGWMIAAWFGLAVALVVVTLGAVIISSWMH